MQGAFYFCVGNKSQSLKVNRDSTPAQKSRRKSNAMGTGAELSHNTCCAAKLNYTSEKCPTPVKFISAETRD